MNLNFNEDFLHYIWKLKKFELQNLETVEGLPIQLINGGFHNYNSGPDFLNAQVKIDHTMWYGNVEIHINSSDWDKHQHQKDPAYGNIILHVVYRHDKEIVDSSERKLYTLELWNRIDIGLIENYQALVNDNSWIPCQESIGVIDTFELNLLIEKLTIERLEDKMMVIQKIYGQNKNDWEQIFIELFLKHFGFKVNNLAFDRLAKLVSLKILRKHADQLFQLEAILFGQAGLLDDSDQYAIELNREYQFLKAKYNLQNMSKHEWQFFRLRPANFPTIRIAQIAAILSKRINLFDRILEINSLVELRQIFMVTLKSYWQEHFRFGKMTKRKSRTLGISSIDSILINVVVPILFFYGKTTQQERYVEIALNLLRKLKAEKNNIIRNWKDLGFKVESAYDTQALLQLKNKYCEKSKCLNCRIGHKIMNKMP